MDNVILDHGFVKLIDIMGSDERVEESARISYGDGTRQTSNRVSLLRYLMRNKHWSPFESAIIQVHLKVPIFVARQIMRHRTFSFNEISGRYSILPHEMYIPSDNQLCEQSTNNKQGRDKQLEPYDLAIARQIFDTSTNEARGNYDTLLDLNLARELARNVLPVSQYTEFFMTGNLRNWLHFLELRLHPHAQYEVRVVAEQIEGILHHYFPITYRAFEDYVLYAVTFSQQEMDLLKAHLEIANIPISAVGLSKREKKEFLDKLGIV